MVWLGKAWNPILRKEEAFMTSMKNERQLRYALRKAGYVLQKSRAKNLSLHNQLGYMIINAQYNICVGGSDYEYTLEDVNQFAECYC